MDGEAQSANFENSNSSEFDLEYWRSSFIKLKNESNLKIEGLQQELQDTKSERDTLAQEHTKALNLYDLVFEQLEVVQDELEQVFLSDRSKAREIQALKQQVCEMVAAVESSKHAQQIYHLSLLELVEQIKIETEKHTLKENEYINILDKYNSLLLRSFQVIVDCNS